MMSQAFYYLRITTTAQSAYCRSHKKFLRYFHFKVIYNMLFYHNIAFCLIHADLFFSISCVIKWKIMLSLYNDQISLLTVLAVIHRSSLWWPPVHNDCKNFVTKWLLYTGLTVVHSFWAEYILFELKKV